MNVPTKEEITKERIEFDYPDGVILGGEVEGFINFDSITKQRCKFTDSDSQFLDCILYLPYPYKIDDIIDYWDNFVRRDGYKVVWDKNEHPQYIDNYSDSQKKNMALAWFDRKLGKFVRVGIMNCSVDTNFLAQIKKSFSPENLVDTLKRKLTLLENKKTN